MTREEAIQFLDNIKHAEAGRAIGKDGFYAELIGYHIEALNMAIKALEHPERNVVAVVPCGDTISRQAVDEIKELMTDINGDTVYAVRMSDIRQLPSVNPQEPKTGHWIPVSERLPEKEGRYLTTIFNEYDNELRYIMACDYFPNGCWCPDDECASRNVIAWMPLPKPFEPQESEET